MPRGIPLNPEITKLRKSAAAKRRWENPDYRAKQQKAAKCRLPVPPEFADAYRALTRGYPGCSRAEAISILKERGRAAALPSWAQCGWWTEKCRNAALLAWQDPTYRENHIAARLPRSLPRSLYEAYRLYRRKGFSRSEALSALGLPNG